MNHLSFILLTLYLVGIMLGNFWEIFFYLCVLVIIAIDKLRTAESSPPAERPAGSPPSSIKTEKELQSEILSVCRRIAPESEIAETLLSIASSASVNVIHACTIVHRLGAMKQCPKLSVKFFSDCCCLIANESVHFKTAISLGRQLAKISDSPSEEFNLSINQLSIRICDMCRDIDASSVCQLIQLLADHPLNEGTRNLTQKLVSMCLKNTALTQPQLAWFMSNEFGRSLFVPGLVGLVDKFQVTGFHLIFQFLRESYPDLVPIVAEKLDVSIDLNRLPFMADLVAVALALPKNETVLNVLIRNFFQINYASMVTLFFGRSGRCPLTTYQVETMRDVVKMFVIESSQSVIPNDRKKLALALRILAIHGVIIRDDSEFVRALFSLVNEMGEDELTNFIIANYGIGECLFSIGTNCTWRSIEVVNLLPQRFAISGSVASPSTECEITGVISLVASQNTEFVELKKTNARKIERFVPHKYIDAINWLVCVGHRHERAREVYDKFVSSPDVSVEEVVLTCIRALRVGRGNSLTAQCVEKLENRLVACLGIIPECYLPDVLEVVIDPRRVEGVVGEICDRVARGQMFCIRDIAYLIDLFGQKKVTVDKMVEDKLFQAIQAWIVPRVNKFTLDEIGLLANALESYTSGFAIEDVASVESDACIDTPVGLFGL